MSPLASEVMGMDWRRQLRINQRRTYWVMGGFVAIYLMIGLLIDWYLHPEWEQVSFAEWGDLLINFQIVPVTTLVMGMVAVIAVGVTLLFHDRLILLGTEYRELVAGHCRSPAEEQLCNILEELRIAAGVAYLPKLYLIEADYPNAFASGYSEKSALIAVTSRLLALLSRSELQAVVAHELSHIRHQDIRLTLMASVLSNLTLMVLDLWLRSGWLGGGRGNRKRDGGNLLVVGMVILRLVLPLVTVLLLLYLSRKREFMADAGAVELMRTNLPLADALIKINRDHEQHCEQYRVVYNAVAHEEVRREAYLFDPDQVGIKIGSAVAGMFTTHPSLAERLQALGVPGADGKF